MNTADLLAIVRHCWAKYTYIGLSDADLGLSFGNQVLAGQAWSGNCKSMCFTLQDLVSRITGTSSLPFQWACRVNTSEGYHWIFVMKSDDSVPQVCGDTEKPGVMLYDFSDCDYDFVECARMDSGDPLDYVSGPPDFTLGAN